MAETERHPVDHPAGADADLTGEIATDIKLNKRGPDVVVAPPGR